MGKLIRYEMLHAVDHGTNENSDIQQTRIPAEIICNTQAQFDANYPIAEKEAIPGTIEVTGEFDPEPDTISTDDVLNALLGVSV